MCWIAQFMYMSSLLEDTSSSYDFDEGLFEKSCFEKVALLLDECEVETNMKRKHPGSQIGHVNIMEQNGNYDQLIHDYFAYKPVYHPHLLGQHFPMSRELLICIFSDMEAKRKMKRLNILTL